MRTFLTKCFTEQSGETPVKQLSGAVEFLQSSESFDRDMSGARKAGLIMVRDDYVWLIA